MTMLQNEGPKGIPNVLHDQGVPNTIQGAGGPMTAAPFAWHGLAMAAALGVLVVLLTFLVLVLARMA